MELDPVTLSRIQFAFTISFHIIFPAFTIGLAAWLATLEGLSLATGRAVYRQLFNFWLKVFAVAFGMGVVSGVVMAFQFGTNWSVLADRTGPIQGPLLGYETYTAFLLEASFLGVVLFGRERVPAWAYFTSCCLVAVGTTFSAFWIMTNNTWMQVPLGYEMENGRYAAADWWTITTNSVLWVRFLHMLLGAYLTTAFCIAATGAWYRLRAIHGDAAKTMLTMGLGLAAVLVPVQMAFGHLNGDYTAKYQPSKFTAIEARWQTEQPARLILFAWPDPENERNLYEISVPWLGSFVDTGSFTSEEPGIVTIPRDLRPPIAIPFFAFRIMVGLGLLMLGLAWMGMIFARQRWESTPSWFLWTTFLSFPSGFIAVLTGWFTAEVGRQPWVVFGLLKTADAVTPSLGTSEAWISLIAFVSVYGLIFSAGTFYIYRLLREGPESPPAPTKGVTALRPMAASGPSPAAMPAHAPSGQAGGHHDD
ncbi:MAG: cytochrome ubiquinol oxidase subunit I [Rhodospirillales bacterium]|nr:cytochrome ubiquinol oxidase subunit I [Rhodospirillales bacterium]